MTYSEALQWRNEHLNLIGTTDEKGFMVSDLFIVPSNSKVRDAFFKNYLDLENREEAIKPYMSGDVQVWSVDLSRLEQHNILFYNVLAV